MALLSAKPISNWCNVNFYTLENQWIVNSGDPLMLYFQIIDTSQAVASLNSSNYLGNFFGSPFTGITAVGTTAGTRYLVGIGAQNQPYAVKVTFPSIDPNQQITVTATQADPNDSSIWAVSIPASQTIVGGNVQFAVYQGNSVMRFSVQDMLDVLYPTSNGMC